MPYKDSRSEAAIEFNRRRIRKYQATPKGREAWARAKRKYLNSPKGRAMRKRVTTKYDVSPKGKVVRKRAVSKYHKSLKGHIALRRANAKRRALKRAATIGDLTEIAKVYERCYWWRKWFDVAVDHIIPLSNGGTHEAKNLQILYQFENRKKHATLDYKPRVIFT